MRDKHRDHFIRNLLALHFHFKENALREFQRIFPKLGKNVQNFRRKRHNRFLRVARTGRKKTFILRSDLQRITEK